MKAFDVLPLRLTPLTPIHIGCGVDFEPTNYVIEDQVLFAFDPSRARFGDADRKALIDAVGARGDEAIRRVQKFFFEHRATFAGISRLAVAVAPGVGRQYGERVGQVAQHEHGGRRVANQLEIERTAHHPHSGVPILPGSSLKGAMRTAWLDGLNRGAGKPAEERSAQEVERRLLGGSFHTDPFRLVRVVDASGESPISKVVFSSNHKKREVMDKDGRVVLAQGPSARREVIVGGQYRAFGGEIRFDSLGGQEYADREGRALAPSKEARISGFRALALATNRYYLKRLGAELRVLDERRFASPDWLSAFRGLLDELKPELDDGAMMILRVGRHSGAESVTLDGIRSIRIMAGKGRPPEYSDVGAKTLWLAAEREDDRSGLLPFGWLLVEAAGEADHAGLKGWCEAQPKPDLSAIRNRLAASREQAAAQAAAAQAQAREREAELAEQQRLKQERDAWKTSLSDQGRMVEALREKLARHAGHKQPVSGALYAEVQKLLKAALQEGWTNQDKVALADLISGLGSERIDFGGKAKEIKRAIGQLRGEA